MHRCVSVLLISSSSYNLKDMDSTMSEKNRRLRMIMSTFSCMIVITGLLLIGFATFKDVEPIEKFKVVDQYQGCEVIRYTDPTNRWNYLLKCK
jgi:hypothetical protein